MARLFLLCHLLEEANALDLNASRRQAHDIRRLQLFTRNQDYVAIYRLSEELIETLFEDIRGFLKTPRRRGRGVSNRIKVRRIAYIYEYHDIILGVTNCLHIKVKTNIPGSILFVCLVLPYMQMEPLGAFIKKKTFK